MVGHATGTIVGQRYQTQHSLNIEDMVLEELNFIFLLKS